MYASDPAWGRIYGNGPNGWFGSDWEFEIAGGWADGFISSFEESNGSVSRGDVRTYLDADSFVGVDFGFDTGPYADPAYYLLYSSVAEVDGVENRDGTESLTSHVSWVDASGSHQQTGTSTVAIGAGTQWTIAGANGKYAILKDDGQGNVVLTGYNADGTRIDDAWIHNDGSNGVDIYAADGSSKGLVSNPNAVVQYFTTDAQGHVTSTDYPGTQLLHIPNHVTPPASITPPPPPVTYVAAPAGPQHTNLGTTLDITATDGTHVQIKLDWSGNATKTYFDSTGHAISGGGVQTDPGYDALMVVSGATYGWHYDVA
jgi:hypothetical protein